jgi:NAD(P)-dependent dehydrogenase (short-subunit alcohol dehydrogenase family)
MLHSSTAPRTPVALVTGASSGIGRATALALHAAGFRTYATARQPDRVADLAAHDLIALALDVRDESSMQQAIARIASDGPTIDVLVNNAGYGQNGPVEELPMPAIRAQFDTNVFGLVRLTQLVLPHMRRAGRGRIINVSSVGGEITAPGAGAYHASKYAVEAFTDALRMEVARFGIQVVSIQPGGVRTEFVRTSAAQRLELPADSPYRYFVEQMERATAKMFASDSAWGILQPEEVATAIVRAATARRPSARYKVGAAARLLPLLRRVLPVGLWDAMWARQFPAVP